MQNASARFALALLAAATFAAGMQWGTKAVGGSDSYCYAHQAERWASLEPQKPEPLALEAPWPDAALTFAPAGHIPSPTVPGAIVPICSAGLGLLMAPFLAIGGPSAIFLVVPLFGALLVVGTGAVGSRYSPAAGLAAAVLTAVSPAFLFQLFQPMSDVPAAALWSIAIAAVTAPPRPHTIGAGLATSLALLVRPNLLPLGLVIGAALMLRPGASWRERLRDAAAYAGCCAPGCLAVGAIQQSFYGSPLSSGYGSLDGLFAAHHVMPNIQRYFGWLWQTHTPIWLLALAAPFVVPGWVTAILLGVIAATLAVYLPYTVFEDWWYLRFLLPAIPLLLVLTMAVIERGVMRVPKVRATAMAGVAIVLAVLFVRVADRRQAFDLARLESRYVASGRYVADRLPADAFVITSWQSGSVRFYSGRRTLAWDALDPGWLDRVVVDSRARGLEPYLLFERWEEPLFRRRFAGSTLAPLDWPPIAEVASQVRIYRPEDRDRYLAGVNITTDYAR